MIEIDITPLKNFSPLVEVVGCFLEKEGKILYLLRSPGKEEGNRWGVPGGKVEPNETIIHASIRELKEEIGIDIEEKDVIPLIPLYFRKNGKDFIFHLIRIKIEIPFEVILNEEHTDARWFLPEEIDSFPMVLGSKKALSFYRDSSS